MRKVLFLTAVAVAIGFWGCHSGKKSIPKEGPITFNEFQQYFPPLVLPYRLSIDTLYAKDPDSTAIPRHVIRQFFPDSVFSGEWAKPGVTKFYPRGISFDKSLYYFVIKAGKSSGSDAYFCLFDKKGKYLGGRLIGSVSFSAPDENTTARIDRKYTLTLTRQRKESAMQTLIREDVFAPNPNGSFSLILTNSNEPASANQIINPIDTLPRKHKYSGNYTAGKLNLVSIRDGRTPKEFRFFIHFSKDKGGCTGEIDGTARFTAANEGEFQEESGPCGIRFKFTSTTVTIRETGGCGAYRGIKCVFEGVFRHQRSAR